MKKQVSPRRAALLLAIGSLLFSACNRGMGCPNNFSIEALVPFVF